MSYPLRCAGTHRTSAGEGRRHRQANDEGRRCKALHGDTPKMRTLRLLRRLGEGTPDGFDLTSIASEPASPTPSYS